MKKELGNPQLGPADPTKPAPWLVDTEGKPVMQAKVCQECGGYFLAECPCRYRNR